MSPPELARAGAYRGLTLAPSCCSSSRGRSPGDSTLFTLLNEPLWSLHVLAGQLARCRRVCDRRWRLQRCRRSALIARRRRGRRGETSPPAVRTTADRHRATRPMHSDARGNARPGSVLRTPGERPCHDCADERLHVVPLCPSRARGTLCRPSESPGRQLRQRKRVRGKPLSATLPLVRIRAAVRPKH